MTVASLATIDAAAAADGADAGDDPRPRRRVVVHPVRGQRRELEERRAGVAEPLDPFAGGQLAAAAVALDRLLAAAGVDPLQLGAQLGDQLQVLLARCPRPSLGRAHRGGFSLKGSRSACHSTGPATSVCEPSGRPSTSLRRARPRRAACRGRCRSRSPSRAASRPGPRVAMLPVAPGGHRAAAELAEARLEGVDSRPRAPPARWPAPWPRVLWKWAVSSTSGELLARRGAKNSPTWSGFAIPVVSPKPISTRAGGGQARGRSRRRARPARSPRRGSRSWSLITPSQRSPSSRRPRQHALQTPVSDSSTERLTLWRLWVSEAERKTLTSSIRSRTSSAAVQPALVRDQHRDRRPRRGSRPVPAPRAPSASCGTTSARTKLVTSSRRRPVRASISTSRTLSSVAIVSGSFWKPSRGPTSRMRTAVGIAPAIALRPPAPARSPSAGPRRSPRRS